MRRVATAAAAELFEFQASRRGLLVLRRHVVALFALRALQNDVISGHNTSKAFVVGCSRLVAKEISTNHEQRSAN